MHNIVWGDEILCGADNCGDLESTWNGLNIARKEIDGSITAAFERIGKGKVTYSHHQHDKTQTRFVVTNKYKKISNLKKSLQS